MTDVISVLQGEQDPSHPGVHPQRSHGPEDEGDGGEGQGWSHSRQGDCHQESELI